MKLKLQVLDGSPKIRVDVPHPFGVIIQDFVLLPGPYYDPNAVFMGWIEIGDLTVAGTILFC